MNIRTLAEVGTRLEETVTGLLDDDATPLDTYLMFENIGISILDSEFTDHPEGVLAHYLQAVLLQKRLELGVDEGDLS
jgi:hypothetical protein